jgi:hypothetical protein
MEEGTLHGEPTWSGTGGGNLGAWRGAPEPAETTFERKVSRVQLRRRVSRRGGFACAIGLMCFLGWLGHDLNQV